MIIAGSNRRTTADVFNGSEEAERPDPLLLCCRSTHASSRPVIAMDSVSALCPPLGPKTPRFGLFRPNEHETSSCASVLAGWVVKSLSDSPVLLGCH